MASIFGQNDQQVTQVETNFHSDKPYLAQKYLLK